MEDENSGTETEGVGDPFGYRSLAGYLDGLLSTSPSAGALGQNALRDDIACVLFGDPDGFDALVGTMVRALAALQVQTSPSCGQGLPSGPQKSATRVSDSVPAAPAQTSPFRTEKTHIQSAMPTTTRSNPPISAAQLSTFQLAAKAMANAAGAKTAPRVTTSMDENDDDDKSVHLFPRNDTKHSKQNRTSASASKKKSPAAPVQRTHSTSLPPHKTQDSTRQNTPKSKAAVSPGSDSSSLVFDSEEDGPGQSARDGDCNTSATACTGRKGRSKRHNVSALSQSLFDYEYYDPSKPITAKDNSTAKAKNGSHWAGNNKASDDESHDGRRQAQPGTAKRITYAEQRRIEEEALTLAMNAAKAAKRGASAQKPGAGVPLASPGHGLITSVPGGSAIKRR
jgi:hypothetical protein